MFETKVIPIEDDETTQKEAEKLKVIIEQNPMLFQIFLAGHNKISLIYGDDEETIYTSSVKEFKKTLSHVIPQHIDLLRQQIFKYTVDKWINKLNLEKLTIISLTAGAI